MPEGGLGGDGLDLNAPADVFDPSDEVVSLAFVPGLGDREPQSCGFAHEGEFGELSALAVIEFCWVAGFVEKGFFWQIGPLKTRKARLQ